MAPHQPPATTGGDPLVPEAPEPLGPRLYRLGEVAALFNCSERTIHNWVRRGLLHPIRIGRTLYFSETDVLRLIHRGASASQRDQ